MRDSDPKGLERLGGQRSTAFKNRTRDHHRHADAVVGKELIDGEQAGLEHQGIKRGFGQEQIDAPGHETGDLFGIAGYDLVKGDVAIGGVVDMDTDT